MKNSNAEFQQLIARWEILRKQRPSETDFAPWGYPGITAEHFDKVFANWRDILNIAVTRTKPSHYAEDQVIDALLLKPIRDLRAHIDAAHGNGLGWLVQSTLFLQWTADVASIMAMFVEKRVINRKDLLKLAVSKLNDQVLSIEKAAPLAGQLTEYQKKLTAEAQVITAAKEGAEKNVGAVAELKLLAEKDQKTINELFSGSEKTKEEADATFAKLKVNLLEAEEKLGEIKKQSEKADAAIGAGTTLIAQANEKLSNAIHDINRQALSGAFSAQASRLGTERGLWAAAFLTSLAWLLSVATEAAGTGDPKVIFDFHNLLKALPVAAPAIWLGWLSVRQMGVLSRIEQDYNYKAATAIAFEGYKKEVIAGNDEALTKQLLETAVRNFGENPIRIYPSKQEQGHPIEGIVDIINDEKRFPKLVEIIKALKPEGKT